MAWLPSILGFKDRQIPSLRVLGFSFRIFYDLFVDLFVGLRWLLKVGIDLARLSLGLLCWTQFTCRLLVQSLKFGFAT